MKIEPRTNPTEEDLAVWIEATRRLLNIPQRTVTEPDGSVVCAVELRLLESMARLRNLYKLAAPGIVLENEAKLIGKRIAAIVDAPVSLQIHIPTSEELKMIELQKSEMRQHAEKALPCPMCGESLRYAEDYAKGWLHHPWQSGCLLAAARIEKDEELKKWNCRKRLAQLTKPTADPRFPDDGQDYGEIEKENADEAAELLEMLESAKACPFCHTRLIFRQHYGIPGLHHPDNNCFLGGQDYCMKEAVDLWNTRTAER
jgi:hypothetical protein